MQAIRTPSDGSSALIQVSVDIKRNGSWFMVDELILDADNNYSVAACYSEAVVGTSADNVFDFRLQLTTPGRNVFLSLQVKKFFRLAVNKNVILPGLRIAGIAEYPVCGPPEIRTIAYRRANNPAESSGIVVGVPVLFQKLPAGSQLDFASLLPSVPTSVTYIVRAAFFPWHPRRDRI